MEPGVRPLEGEVFLDPVSCTHPASDAVAKIAVTSTIRFFIGVLLDTRVSIALPFPWHIMIDLFKLAFPI